MTQEQLRGSGYKVRLRTAKTALAKPVKLLEPATARRYDPLCDKPFHTVSSDVKVVNTESLGGFRYAVNFVDGYTSLHCLFMWTKNEVTTKLEEFISDF